jgi:hypothetical protein
VEQDFQRKSSEEGGVLLGQRWTDGLERSAVGCCFASCKTAEGSREKELQFALALKEREREREREMAAGCSTSCERRKNRGKESVEQA